MAASLDDRLLEIFLDLVRIDGLSGLERPVADRVVELLSDYPVQVREDSAGADCGNLICRFGDGGSVLLASHMDTARSTSDLVAKVSGDRVHSAGSTILGADNRAGMAVLLYTLERAATKAFPANGFTVAFTVREETDLGGARALEIPAGMQSAYVFDSSYRPGSFIQKAWGAIRFSGEIRGRAAHSGLAPEQGIDALQVACRALAALRLGRIDEESVANIGLLRAGTAVNVVPDRVEFEGEVRATTRGRVQEIFDEIAARIEMEAASSGAEASLLTSWDFEPYEIDSDSRAFRHLVAALGRSGLEATTRSSAGGSDANALNAKGLETINLGIGAQNPHADDEFILLEDLAASARIAEELVKRTDV